MRRMLPRDGMRRCAVHAIIYAMGSNVIRNVIFDIGWVLVDLTPENMLRWLDALAVPDLTLESVTQRIALTEHESGRINGEQLLHNLASLPARAPDNAIEQARSVWLDMFALQQPMIDLLHRIAKYQRVYLLSNVGDLHWAHLSRTYGIDQLGHGALPSFMAGVMKPHADIYLQAEQRFSLIPNQTVFIDDRADNIAAAQSRGWHGIVHRGYDTTYAALRSLAVRDSARDCA